MTRTTASLIAVLWAAWAAGPAIAQTGGVTVLRGGASETVVTAQAAAGAIEVLRGTAVASRPPAERRSRATRGPTLVAAGETLWLSDARTGRLIACWVGGSSVAGRSAIRCAAR